MQFSLMSLVLALGAISTMAAVLPAHNYNATAAIEALKSLNSTGLEARGHNDTAAIKFDNTTLPVVHVRRGYNASAVSLKAGNATLL
jgi:hypothetical protein